MVSSEASIPEYWLPQPPMLLDADTRRACDELLFHALSQGVEQPFTYTLPIPKWQFLCYIIEAHNLALHGSGQPTIARFEPHQSVDFEEFGAQTAVYAAADGIWPLYFAIVDRAKSLTIMNGCVRIEQPDGTLGLPHYFFSISQNALDQQPYRNGMLYLLPSETFIAQPPIQVGTKRIHIAQLASLEAVVPLAKLAVTPEDFPFLEQMRFHDDARLEEYALAMQQGLPLPT